MYLPEFLLKVQIHILPYIVKTTYFRYLKSEKIKSKDKFDFTKLLLFGNPKSSVPLSWPLSDDDCCWGGGGGHHGGLSHPEARYDRAFFAFGDGEAFYNPLPETPFPLFSIS